jgi:hypothetical protein
MNRTKFLKGECQHCAGHLEFPAEMAGLPTDCPHCGKQTELLLAARTDEPIIPRRTIVWAVIGIVILGLGLVGSLVALKRAERWAARQKRHAESAVAIEGSTNAQAEITPSTEEPQSQNSFLVSAVALEKAPGTSLIYAVGTVKNTSDHQRFGVKVELDLFDGNEQKVGTATDYQQVMETNTVWRFKALVVDSKATSAKVAAIKEDQ